MDAQPTIYSQPSTLNSKRSILMNSIALICLFTFVIHLISTLSYAVRIVGVRTRRIAISFSLFNVLVLVSRTANGFQAPLLAKKVEGDIQAGIYEGLGDFRWIILASTVATIVGAGLIPTFQRVLSKLVHQFSIHKSIPKLLLHGFSKHGILHLKQSIAIPKATHVKTLMGWQHIPKRLFVFNVIAVAILTVGVLASLYAGYLNPELRSTASNLSSVINGLATILLFIFIDPYVSGLTDDVMMGKCSEVLFRQFVIWMVIARLLGTLIAQILLLPAAQLIAQVATMM